MISILFHSAIQTYRLPLYLKCGRIQLLARPKQTPILAQAEGTQLYGAANFQRVASSQ